MKKRTLKELYEVTEEILEPEMTPVLKGSYRIQGPTDEVDHDTLKNTESSRAENRIRRHSMSDEVHTRAESGTCNVCAAPCSPCMHFNQAGSCVELDVKDEFSDATSTGKVGSQCSFNDGNVLPTFKKRVCGDRHNATSETSNLLSVCSSHGSLSENAESKASLRTFDSSENVEMLPNVSLVGIASKHLLLSKPQTVTCQNVFISSSIQSEQRMGLECAGDNISCVSANMPVGDVNVDVDKKDVSCSSASIGSFLPEATAGLLDKSGQSNAPSLKDFSIGDSSKKVWSPYPHSQSGKSNFHNSDAKDLEANSCSHQQDEPSECPTNHVESSFAKLATPDGGSEEKSTTQNCNNILPKFENSKASSFGASVKIYPCLEAGSDMHIENYGALPEDADNREPPLESLINDNRDESDTVEADVKVCDICGDAGREYLLAICSRCSDGAEHTYCMRIMMDKVPEGEWICEGCTLKEESENQKQDKFETELGTSKASCVNGESQTNSGGTLNTKVFLKVDVMDGPNPQFSSKINSDSVKVASATKRQDLEISGGSSELSSPRKKAPLSRESSFKNLDKGKVKTIHPIPSFGVHSTNNSQSTAHSPTTALNPSRILPGFQLPTGTLSKSNSFNTLNSKPKVKLLLEDPSEKHKLARGSATSSTKKGPMRTMNKSLSLKIGSSHSNSNEPKVKTLSSNLPRAEDLRGLKLAKVRNGFGRKSSFRSDCALVSPTAASKVSSSKAEQKIASRGETLSMLSSATNNQDLKGLQPDGKLGPSSKPTSFLVNQRSETPNALAGRSDMKRQSSLLSSAVDSASFNGRCNSILQKPSLVSPKDEPMANSTNGLCSNPDAVLQDSLPQSRETTNEARKYREPSFSQSLQSDSAGSRSICCHKCKEIGHTAENCPIGTPPVSAVEASVARSSREVMNSSIQSKMEVGTSLLKRSGMYKRSRLLDKSAELSRSSADLSCEVALKDQESCGSPTADSSRTTTVTSEKHHTLHPTKVVCDATLGDPDAIIPLDVNNSKPSMSDSLNLASSVAISPRVFPAVDYIWQGGFEVQRNGRFVDFYDGIQAHVSICASHKVPEVVNKFPQKVQLEEVPRLNIWPTQFQNSASEDNIALYFFAKDLESYERSYKSLLENMIKNDLALRGNFDGFELLIFPSNQLHEKSQRWNMLFFLWGVFRGQRVNCAEHISGSLKKFSAVNLNGVSAVQELPTSVMAVSEIDCTSGSIDEDFSTFSRSLIAQEAIKSPVSMRSPILKSSGTSDQQCLDSEENCLGSSSVSDTNLLSRIPTSDAKLLAETKGSSTSMQEHGDPKSREEIDLERCSRQNSNLCEVQMVPTHLKASFPSISPHRQETSSDSSKVRPPCTSSLAPEVVSVDSRVEEKVLERMEESSKYEVKNQEKMKDDGLVIAEIDLESDPMEKEHSSLEPMHSRKRPYSASLEMVSQASGETSMNTSQAMSWKSNSDIMFADGENECKKMKKGRMQDSGPTFLNLNESLDGANDDMVILESLQTTKNYLIPVGLGPTDSRLGSKSIPLQVLSSDDDDDQLESEAPNLELALGAEKRQPKPGILPLFVELGHKENNQGPLQDLAMDNKDDDLLASLSLSLCLPVPDKEKTVKPVSRTDGNHVDTSLILFGGFSDT